MPKFFRKLNPDKLNKNSLKIIEKNFPYIEGVKMSFQSFINYIDSFEGIPENEKLKTYVEKYRKNKKIKKRNNNRIYKENKRKLLEDLKENYIAKLDIEKLKNTLMIFNEPEDYKTLFQTIESTPLLRNSIEKKVKTYYFDRINSVKKIKNTIMNLYKEQKEAFKIKLTFGFVFEKADSILEYNNEKDEWFDTGKMKYE